MARTRTSTKRKIKKHGNYVDKSDMMVYAEYMVFSICSYGDFSYQVERLVAELVCELTHCLSSSQSKKEIPTSAAADVEDVQQGRQGDSDAYQRLIERHQEHVGLILWRFSRDRRLHEELVQDVFVEAYLSLGSYRAKAPFAHWLSRIATRVGYRYWKQNARWQKRQSLSLQEWDRLDDKTTQPRCTSGDVSQAAVLTEQQKQIWQDRLQLLQRQLQPRGRRWGSSVEGPPRGRGRGKFGPPPTRDGPPGPGPQNQ